MPASAIRCRKDRVTCSACALGDGDDLLELFLEQVLLPEGGRASLERERAHRHLPAVVDAADHVVLVGFGAIEKHLGKLGAPAHLLDRAHLDAVLLHRNQDVADAAVLWRLGIGAAQHEAPVRVFGARGPDLLPFDDPLVADERGLRLDVGEVGPGSRLRVPLTPDLVALKRSAARSASVARGEPKWIRVGPSSVSPMCPTLPGPFARTYSSLKTASSLMVQPRPPNSFGQPMQFHPAAPMVLPQAIRSSMYVSCVARGAPALEIFEGALELLLQPCAGFLAERLFFFR